MVWNCLINLKNPLLANASPVGLREMGVTCNTLSVQEYSQQPVCNNSNAPSRITDSLWYIRVMQYYTATYMNKFHQNRAK